MTNQDILYEKRICFQYRGVRRSETFSPDLDSHSAGDAMQELRVFILLSRDNKNIQENIKFSVTHISKYHASKHTFVTDEEADLCK